jgi:hypothetical protein
MDQEELNKLKEKNRILREQIRKDLREIRKLEMEYDSDSDDETYGDMLYLATGVIKFCFDIASVFYSPPKQKEQ